MTVTCMHGALHHIVAAVRSPGVIMHSSSNVGHACIITRLRTHRRGSRHGSHTGAHILTVTVTGPPLDGPHVLCHGVAHQLRPTPARCLWRSARSSSSEPPLRTQHASSPRGQQSHPTRCKERVFDRSQYQKRAERRDSPRPWLTVLSAQGATTSAVAGAAPWPTRRRLPHA